MQDIKTVVKLLANMDEEAQAHFREVLQMILPCYADNEYHCVIVVMKGDKGDVNIRTITANEMYSLQALQCAMDFFEFLNVRDAPAKEKFN